MRRIQRARDKEKTVEALTSGEAAMFGEIWQLLLFAAAVGFRHGRKEKLGEVDSGKAINPLLFEKSAAGPGFSHLLALVVDGDARHLAGTDDNDDVRVTLFEQYANGGLALLTEELEKTSYSLDSMIRFLESDQPVAGEGSLSDIQL